MRTTFVLIFIALFTVPAASAQERLVLLAVNYLDDVEGPWEIQSYVLPNGGRLYIETSDGETSTLEIPSGSSVRIIGHELIMKSTHPKIEQAVKTTLVGDVMISVTPTRLVRRKGKDAFNEAKTKLRFKYAVVFLSPYER